MTASVESSEYSIALHAGTIIGGQYRIIGVLGHPGGFGITYLAEETQLDTTVAIKEYLPRDLATRSPDRSTVAVHSGDHADRFTHGLDQFLREARMVAKISHPNVVRVRTFFEANATAYLVMDYLEGETLSALLTSHGGTLAPDLAFQVMDRVLDGLRACHAQQIYHRDIKPANIYIQKSGNPVLLDFGAARQASGQHSMSMTAILTAGYAPIEQYGQRGQGPWTDVYAAGAVLYRMLTGLEVAPATDRVDDDPVVPPAQLNPAISKALSDVVMHAVAVYGKQRPQSVDELQQRLEGAVTGQPIVARREPTSGGAPRVGSTSVARAKAVVPDSDKDGGGPVAQPAGRPPSDSGRGARTDAASGTPRPGTGNGKRIGIAIATVLGAAAMIALYVHNAQPSGGRGQLPDSAATGTSEPAAFDSTRLVAQRDSAIAAQQAEALARLRRDSLQLAALKSKGAKDSLIAANRRRDSIIAEQQRLRLAELARADSLARVAEGMRQDSIRRVVAARRADSIRADGLRRDSVQRADIARQQDAATRAEANRRDSIQRADNARQEAIRLSLAQSAATLAHAGEQAATAAAGDFLAMVRSPDTRASALAIPADVDAFLKTKPTVRTSQVGAASADGDVAQARITMTVEQFVAFSGKKTSTFVFRALVSQSGGKWGNPRIEIVK